MEHTQETRHFYCSTACANFSGFDRVKILTLSFGFKQTKPQFKSRHQMCKENHVRFPDSYRAQSLGSPSSKLLSHFQMKSSMNCRNGVYMAGDDTT